MRPGTMAAVLTPRRDCMIGLHLSFNHSMRSIWANVRAAARSCRDGLERKPCRYEQSGPPVVLPSGARTQLRLQARHDSQKRTEPGPMR